MIEYLPHSQTAGLLGGRVLNASLIKSQTPVSPPQIALFQGSVIIILPWPSTTAQPGTLNV